MIICRKYGYPSYSAPCACLSTSKNEYAGFSRFVRAPRYTVDLDDGSIIPGRAAFGKHRLHRIIEVSSEARDFIKTVFAGATYPAKYRYLSFNETSYGWTGMKSYSDSGSDLYLLSDVGYVKFYRLELLVPSGYRLTLVYTGADPTSLMFGDRRAKYIMECRETVSSIVNEIVMHGMYTDKQPNIYGSEEADLI